MVLETLPQHLKLSTDQRSNKHRSASKNPVALDGGEDEVCDSTARMSLSPQDSYSPSDDDLDDDNRHNYHHGNSRDDDCEQDYDCRSLEMLCSNNDEIQPPISSSPSIPESHTALIPPFEEATIRPVIYSILKNQEWEPVVKMSRPWKQLERPRMGKIMAAQFERLASQPRRRCEQPQLYNKFTGEEIQNNTRLVTFHTVDIRKFDRCAGDNPAVSFGPPISLDWTFVQLEPIPIDEYEAANHRQRLQLRGPRQFCLNHFQRCAILEHWCGLSKQEIRNVQREAEKCKRERNMSILLLPYMKVEDMLQSATRKARRKLGGN
jgi:hypothetical protein